MKKQTKHKPWHIIPSLSAPSRLCQGFIYERTKAMKTQEQKIKQFAELLERQQIKRLYRHNLACEANIINAKVSTKQGKKYIK